MASKRACFICQWCGTNYPVDGCDYLCHCGGIFKYKGPDISEASLLSLGEVQTPVVKSKIGNHELYLKLDYYFPTGSFKDRGSRLLISTLSALGISKVVEDSSGNAGASIAAYAAAAGMDCDIYVPETAPTEKMKQIQLYGANIHKIAGGREKTSEAVKAAAKSCYYASHVYNPLFIEGTKGIANEIYHQVGVPDKIIVPVGNGSLLLGLYRGFKALGRLPMLYAVQAQNCSPLYEAFYNLPAEEKKATAAGGIAIQKPAQIHQILHAISDSNGAIIVVNEEEIGSAKKELAENGIFVESTAAVGLAGAKKALNLHREGWVLIRDNEHRDRLMAHREALPCKKEPLVILTGTGLKEPL